MEPIIATVNVPWSNKLPEFVEQLMAKKFSVAEVRVSPIEGNTAEAKLELFLK